MQAIGPKSWSVIRLTGVYTGGARWAAGWNCLMAAIWESEWQLLMETFKYDSARRALLRWSDVVEDEEKPLVYDEDDFAHLSVWSKDASALILTLHPKMGLAHKHVEVEPCAKGTKGDVWDIYIGYFMSTSMKKRWRTRTLTL
jgi:hypothetical protein